MTEVLSIASTIILSLGGSGAIIIGLSNWLGKIWANRILEKEKHKYTKELEEYKNTLSEKMSILNSLIDKSSFVTKLQYEKEFSIYQEIWEALVNCIRVTKRLYPKSEDKPIDQDKLEEFQIKKWEEYLDSFIIFSNIVDKYAPFYEEEIYKKFNEVRVLCNNQGMLFKRYTFDIRYSQTFVLVRDMNMSPEETREVYITFHEEIGGLQKHIQKQIKEYLKSLQAL